MKWNASTAAFLLSCLVVAIPIDAAGVVIPEAMIEVTVWVDEHGQTLSVETMQPTATVGNVSISTRRQTESILTNTDFHCPSSYPRNPSPRSTAQSRACHRSQHQHQSKQ
jgi:hypothetical protein